MLFLPSPPKHILICPLPPPAPPPQPGHGQGGENPILSGQSCSIPESEKEQKQMPWDLSSVFLVPKPQGIVFSKLNKSVVLRIIRYPLSFQHAQILAFLFLSK